MILLCDRGERKFVNFLSQFPSKNLSLYVLVSHNIILYVLVEYCILRNSSHGGGRVWSDHYVVSHNIDKVLYSIVQYRKKIFNM